MADRHGQSTRGARAAKGRVVTPLAAFGKFVSDAERLGFVTKDTTAEDVEALLDGVFGPGDDDDECGEDDYEDSGFDAFDDYEDEICNICGGPADECECEFENEYQRTPDEGDEVSS